MKLKGNLFWAVTNQIILSLGAVAIIIILSNVLEAETFGKTRFLAAILAIFAFFSLPGIAPVMLKQASIYSKEDFKYALDTQIKWGLGATFGALIFSAIFFFQDDTDLALAFAISGLLAPIANLYLMPGTALAGLKKFRKKTLYDSFIILVTVLGAWYGSYATGTVFGTMFWYFGIQSIATVIGLYLVTKHLNYLFEKPSHITTHDTKYGKQLTIFQIPFTLLPALEKVLVFTLLGPIALATYIIAFLPIEHIRNAYRNTLQFFVLPQLKGNDINHWIKIAFLLSFGSALCIIIFAFLLLPLLFSEFTNVKNLMLISSLIPLTLPAYIFILKLLEARKIESLYTYSIITVVIDVLVFIVLTSSFGLHGAVLAKIFTSFITAVVAIILYKQAFKKIK